MQNFQVKKVSSKEFAERLAKIHQATFPDKYWKKDDFISAIESPFREIIALFIDESIEGFCLYSRVENTSEILSLAVTKKMRGKGYGEILLQKTIDECRHYGIKNIFLEVAIDNKEAIKLYEKFNFKEIGIRKDYYNRVDGKIDAKTYSLEL